MKKVQGGTTTKYKYDGISVLMEKDGSNNTVATYTLGPGLIGQILSVRRGGGRMRGIIMMGWGAS